MYALHSYRGIRSFAEAKQQYNNVNPWRGETEWGLPRPLRDTRNTHPEYASNNRSRNYSIEPLDDCAAYSLCYHSTELVRYHSDGRITITGHDSISSSAFINSNLPDGLSFSSMGYPHLKHYWVECSGFGQHEPVPYPEWKQFKKADGSTDYERWQKATREYWAWKHDDVRSYAFHNTVTMSKVNGLWMPDEADVQPVVSYRSDRSATIAALKKVPHYYDFLAFASAYAVFAGDAWPQRIRNFHWQRKLWFTRAEPFDDQLGVALLDRGDAETWWSEDIAKVITSGDRTRWKMLCQSTYNAKDARAYALAAVKAAHGIDGVIKTTQPYVIGMWTSQQSIIKGTRKYG